jgi:hypothetical protein
METYLTIQVHVLKPSWIQYEKNRYRLYVDDCLLTERDWIWDLNTFIEENIYITSEPGQVHHLRLEPILKHKSVAQFVLRTLKVNGQIKPDNGGDKLEITVPIQ